MAPGAEITVTIPGEPVAQGRPRAFVARKSGRPRLYDPPRARAWKAAARAWMTIAMNRRPPLLGPVLVRIQAVWACPRDEWRVRAPRKRRDHGQRPDAENVAKAVLDAASGICYRDDAQVAKLYVEKFIGAQDEPARVELQVVPLEQEARNE